MKGYAGWLEGLEKLRAAAGAAPLLTAQEEGELARRGASGHKRSRDALLTAHLRLVLAIACEFRVHRVPADELVSEGLLGLVEAARRFDSERGTRFATYAAFWIRAYMRRYTLANRRVVRTPSTRNARTLLGSMRGMQRKVLSETGQWPDAEVIAKACGVEVSDVLELRGAIYGRDVPCGPATEEGCVELRSEDPSPELMVAEADEQRNRKQRVHRALASLPQRERKVIELRQLGEEATTLADIGRTLGVSRERVRQLEQRAHDTMRRALLADVA